ARRDLVLEPLHHCLAEAVVSLAQGDESMGLIQDLDNEFSRQRVVLDGPGLAQQLYQLVKWLAEPELPKAVSDFAMGDIPDSEPQKARSIAVFVATAMLAALRKMEVDLVDFRLEGAVTRALSRLAEDETSWSTPGPPGSVGRDSSTGNLCFESASVALRPRNAALLDARLVTLLSRHNATTSPLAKADRLLEQYLGVHTYEGTRYLITERLESLLAGWTVVLAMSGAEAAEMEEHFALVKLVLEEASQAGYDFDGEWRDQ
ncbi:MAG: hypothetical protein HN348_31815, partial [Proteobacteria bacterium]|nr:hypothetical protein [Pseudomonadota bacterium]